MEGSGIKAQIPPDLSPPRRPPLDYPDLLTPSNVILPQPKSLEHIELIPILGPDQAALQIWNPFFIKQRLNKLKIKQFN